MGSPLPTECWAPIVLYPGGLLFGDFWGLAESGICNGRAICIDVSYMCWNLEGSLVAAIYGDAVSY